MNRFDASIVIPVFNRPDLLRLVLAGLSRQTVHPGRFEVLVCDDGSTEDLAGVVASFEQSLPNLKLFRQHNQGPAAARNMGTRAAIAGYVIYLDSDVLPDESLVEQLVQGLSENSSWIGAEASVEPFDGEANVLWDAPVCDKGGVYLTAAIIYRLDVIKKIGGFDQTFLRAACEDVELATRAMRFGEIGFIPAAKVLHPRRRKTVRFFWNKRKDWRYLVYLAIRHQFIGWPGNVTRFPRLRLTWSAVVTQPAGRLFEAIRLLFSSPAKGGIAIGHAFVCGFSGICALPDIWFASPAPVRDYLVEDHPL